MRAKTETQNINDFAKSVYIKTFGCQMNEHDTGKMLLVLEGIGYSYIDDMENADLVLFNTCSIREKAHHKAISEIGRASQIKRKRPQMLLGICGCVAQQEGKSLLRRYPEINILFGPDQIAQLPNLITKAIAGNNACALDLVNDARSYRFIEDVPVQNATPSSTFVLAMKGCNCTCSYCIVPSVRGREISRPADDIVKEVSRLAEGGAKEITLLGQNVSAYRDASGKRGAGLASLIRKISQETDIERIRFTSPHPQYISDDLIEEFAQNKKLCPHIHLPVQAGSNEVLKRMRRGYTRELYIDKATRLRKAKQGMSITTDLIVGFCGETERDFDLTLDIMQSVGFDSAFAFMYSPRPGTEAADKMVDDISAQDKQQRLEKLLALQRKMTRGRNEALVGSEGDVLTAGLDRMQRGLLTGRRADNRIVHFPGNSNMIGDIVRVRVTGAHDNSLSGEAI
ncbi:MAG: tRNA (N6-isopentenyl adenosine(37)-C2)-methylthiotransferase MiaB [Pseudomonadota bacterium]